MEHREVGVAVCGIIVGTMIGAGFVSSGRDTIASLAEVDEQFVAYRQGFIAEDQYRRRSISENDRRYRRQARLRTPSGVQETQGDIEVGVVLDPAECVNKVRIAREIEDIVIPIIPGRAIDQLVRSSIQEVFDDYIEDCLPYYEESLQTEEESADVEFEVKTESQTPYKGENCNKYSGARRSNCVVEQRRNE